MRGVRALTGVLLVVAGGAAAQDPAPSPSPTPGPVRFSAWLGREVRWVTDQTERTDSNVGGLAVEGPLVLGPARIADIRVELALRALPKDAGAGEVLDPTDPGTWGQSAEVHVAVAHGVGLLEAGGQRITTTLLARAGWATGIEEATGRYMKDYSVRLEFAERQSGARLSVGFGRHPLGDGYCVQVDGAFPFAALGAGIRTTLLGEAFLGQHRSFMRIVAAVAR